MWPGLTGKLSQMARARSFEATILSSGRLQNGQSLSGMRGSIAYEGVACNRAQTVPDRSCLAKLGSP